MSLHQDIDSGVRPDTHPVLYKSKTPVSVDGYALGEVKALACPHPECGGYVMLDRDPDTPGWEDPRFHDRDCPYYHPDGES